MKALFGLSSSKKKDKDSKRPLKPYEHLKYLPRYQQVEVELLGAQFNVADPLSFYYSYKEIFLDEIYQFHCSKKNPVILDCGSNYGASLVYFKLLFPDATITGIEADPAIYALLEKNIAQRQYRNVTLLNKAVSTADGMVTFNSEGADGGRIFDIKGCEKQVSIQAVQLDALITGPVDFLKMDIEGAEGDVICHSKKLEYVDQLFIEYHSFTESKQNLGAMLEKLSSAGFRYYVHTQFCSPRPLTEDKTSLGMDLQLNIFAKKNK